MTLFPPRSQAFDNPRNGPSDPLLQKDRDVFRPPFVEVIPFTLEAADRCAEIRAVKGVSAADAIHLACAAQAHTDLFLTNEPGLIGKVIPGIQFIAGIDSDVL
jgi:hypothetical protein